MQFLLIESEINQANAAESYQFVTKWGSEGTGDGQFNYPYGIAVNPSGNVHVTDTDNNRIQKFSSSGAFITKWGSYGTGDGQFDTPSGVAVDALGNVYVADSSNRIQKLSPTGTFITKWGSKGTGDSQFYYPTGIAVDASGNVYVADLENNRVQKFSSIGTFITKLGSKGTEDGQFYYPQGVTVDSLGNVYVADSGNYRVQKFAPFVKGKIYGYVVTIRGYAIDSVKLKDIGTKTVKNATSDGDGYFEFTDMDAGTYLITAMKKGYKKARNYVELEEGREQEVEITMKAKKKG